jgi:hypothetical protein
LTREPPIRRDGPLLFYSAWDAVIVARAPRATFRLARVTFGKDGSIYIRFPYCKRSRNLEGKQASQHTGAFMLRCRS